MSMSHVCYSQYDSLVIYYRELGADYRFINNDIHRIKEFAFGKKIINDRKSIKEIIFRVEKLKIYKDSTEGMSNGYLLGAYGYRNGQEDLVFTISSFHRLSYKGDVYLYKHKFLDLLFSEKLMQYY